MLRYLGIVSGMLVILAFGAVSFWLAWPWVLSENMRLTQLELALTWLAEAGALLWFLYFLGKFMVTSETESVFDEDLAYSPGTQFMAVVVILAAAVDLGATFYFEAQSGAKLKTATPGLCRVHKLKTYQMEPALDKKGNQVGTRFCAFAWCNIVGEDGKQTPMYFYGKSSRFPEEIHDAVIRNRLPFEMDILYDEKFPRRFWLEGEQDDYMSVWRLSQEITIFAIVFTLLVLVTNKALFSTSIPIEVCPLVGIVIRMAMAGWYMFFHDQTSMPPF